jgi:hypothetical protein
MVGRGKSTNRGEEWCNEVGDAGFLMGVRGRNVEFPAVRSAREDGHDYVCEGGDSDPSSLPNDIFDAGGMAQVAADLVYKPREEFGQRHTPPPVAPFQAAEI